MRIPEDRTVILYGSLWRTAVFYMKLVCENEDMALYFDDLKTLDMRAVSAVNGTLLGVCSYGSNATFTNIHMYIPG